MGNSVYIVSVDAKDLFLANYSSPNSKEYSVKLAGSDHNDQFNTRRFVNTLDYSLDLIKLREVYEKVYRRMDFTFSKRGKEYCRRVINVTFKYSVKEFNRFFDNTYIKYGYLPQDVQLTDNICIKDGELIAVRVGSPVENPASPQELGDLFVFDNGMYRLGKTMKVLLTVAQLRNRLYQDGFTCDGIVLPRFFDIRSGEITIDGHPIRRIKRNNLRQSMAIVLQDTHLFTGTVRENIRFGRLDATDEEVIAAAKLTAAHSFIKRLPQGYDTLLENDGANLSQGQRQLLNIARAAIADPPILLLDEATSNIDTRSEILIQKGLDQLMQGRTSLIIAHRLSTVRNADLILVLEHGKIIEQGSHQELLALKGKYYSLNQEQFE